jgi:hypothetical protein
MNNQPEIPFESIEGSMEYVSLLADVIEEASQDIASEIALAQSEGAERRKEALQLVAFKLAKLSSNISTSKRIMNDLRTLRRLLLEERRPLRVSAQQR